MARALLASGAGKGTRVGLLAPDGALWLTTFYAALRIGALVTPISTLATPPELAHILRTSDAQILIGARRFLRRDFADNLAAALPGLARRPARRAAARRAPRTSARSGSTTPTGCRGPDRSPSSSTVADAPDAPDAALLAAVEREVSPGDDAFVVYTSGSTAHAEGGGARPVGGGTPAAARWRRSSS